MRHGGFYRGMLGRSEGRSAPTWVNLNYFGHENSLHLEESCETKPTGRVGQHLVPMPHLGVALRLEDWKAIAASLEARALDCVLAPTPRFEGEPGEQWTAFFLDTSGNPIEITGFRSFARLFQSA